MINCAIKKFVFVAIPLRRWGCSKMQNEKRERWRELCEQIAIEPDLKKLHALIAELSRALEERQERLTGK
jgi:hypothetical protein